MFEEQTQKLYEGVMDKIDGLFSKKPFIFSLSLSALVSIGVFIATLNYKKGEAAVEITQEKETSMVETSALSEIAVDLAGAVGNPGIYKLGSDSRVADLIKQGGGLTSNVSAEWVSKKMNLADKLTDGAKVYVPFEWDVVIKEGNIELATLDLTVKLPPAKESTSTQNTSSDINVNLATAEELDTLPGVGPAYAGRIMENRPYTSLDDFKGKSTLPASLVENLQDLISF